MSFHPKEKQGTGQFIWLCWRCAMQGRLPEDCRDIRKNLADWLRANRKAEDKN